ncbi:UNVERIFIED_CONTAM: hypothetical protein PYX00_009421 [Menopon gallinae]|uniref:Uncharacterized protein n=1 Tax=Menopon gallinae TaxID=328185 RepID=A0AAW2HB05_9NEOP
MVLVRLCGYCSRTNGRAGACGPAITGASADTEAGHGPVKPEILSREIYIAEIESESQPSEKSVPQSQHPWTRVGQHPEDYKNLHPGTQNLKMNSRDISAMFRAALGAKSRRMPDLHFQMVPLQWAHPAAVALVFLQEKS